MLALACPQQGRRETEGENVRKVTSGFRVLGLLFCEQSGEGDDVSVDILLSYRRSTVAVRHVGYAVYSDK